MTTIEALDEIMHELSYVPVTGKENIRHMMNAMNLIDAIKESLIRARTPVPVASSDSVTEAPEELVE